jgi:hypothetical protein
VLFVWSWGFLYELRDEEKGICEGAWVLEWLRVGIHQRRGRTVDKME